MISFDVRYRWSNSVKFTAQIDCAEDAPFSVKLGLAVKWRVSTRADLTRANLTDADLTDADLTDADLTDANLIGADLTRANLIGANLTRANLTRADLTRADLTGANLTGANLTDADLTDADLTDADLTGANLTRANLRSIRADFFDVLLRAIPEVPGLLRELRAGNIDGSTYTGSCACLVGTIANIRAVGVDTLDYRDSGRAIERWFMNIRPGETPASTPVAKITEDWLLEFMALVGIEAPNEGSAT